MLLMLSTSQPPDPRDEIAWHARRWLETGEPTPVAITHPPSGLRRGHSIVAFYGSADLDNSLLGHGIFAGYERKETDTGKTLTASIPLYAASNLPTSTKGFVKLTGVAAAEASASIDSLGGFIEATGFALTVENLPTGPARAQVYSEDRNRRP